MNAQADSFLERYQATQAYLKLSTLYCDYLGGIRWSNDDDALAYPDAKIFIFLAPLAEFLEGFATGGRVIPFACVLHWIDLLVDRRHHFSPEVLRLRTVFGATGSNWRNAGAWAAVASAGIPEVADPPRLDHVCQRLRDRAFPIRWFTTRFRESVLTPPETPPLAPAAFEQIVVPRLAAYSDDDLRSWLQHGRGPVREAAAAVAQASSLPRSLAGVLAALLRRPRLTGAETYVMQLVGALTLPPRWLAPQELPVGGYTDMTARGAVEHILPSQHALDDLEFLRRFAEHELLFFRREEPPAQNRQDVIVLIDQGVRTWGDVRLVLAAAALALGKQCADRGKRFLLAGTSNAGRLADPLAVDDRVLGSLIDASDLSRNPGAALEAILEQPPEAPRDVVLLTHPRSLREPDVRAAALRAGAHDRVFGVTLDEAGGVVVSELRHGLPITLRQFQIEFAVSTPMPVPVAAAEARRPWAGDVEPVPFPFRFGTDGPVTFFEFDFDAHFLLTVSAGGMLHLWSLDSDDHEVLPRPYIEDVLLNVKFVTGVKGGFVLSGLERGKRFVAHYDLARRHCKVHEAGGAPTAYFSERYVPELNSLLLLSGNQDIAPRGCTLNLTTGECLSLDEYSEPSRAQEAWDASKRLGMRATDFGGRHALQLEFEPSPGLKHRYTIDSRGGTIKFTMPGFSPIVHVPLSDGKPLLKNSVIFHAHAAAHVLVIKARLADGSAPIVLMNGRDGRILREHRLDSRNAATRKQRTLFSVDGSWLAIERTPRIEVECVADSALRVTTRCGFFSPDGRLYVGAGCFILSLGAAQKHWHLVRWSPGTVEFRYELKRSAKDPFKDPHFDTAVQPASPRQRDPFFWRIAREPRRYLAAGVSNGLCFALDRFGQVAAFDDKGTLLCMFMAFRDRLAAWLPDGSRCGSSALGLGPETPGAREKLAAILNGVRSI